MYVNRHIYYIKIFNKKQYMEKNILYIYMKDYIEILKIMLKSNTNEYDDIIKKYII